MTLLRHLPSLALTAGLISLLCLGACADGETGGDQAADDELPSWLPDRSLAPDEDITATAEPDLPEPLGHVITLHDGTGIDVVADAFVPDASFANADLFATHNSDGLRLSTGGPSPTVSRPVNWFIGTDSKPILFSSFADIPAVLPPDDMTAALPIA